MQISVVGKEGDDSDLVSDNESSGDDDVEEDAFKEDTKVSQKHQKHINLDERDKEDMDFPDEIDTPADARIRL